MISINLEVIEKHIKRSKKFVAFIYDNLIFPLFWDYIHNLFIWVYSKTFFNINKLSKLNFTKKQLNAYKMSSNAFYHTNNCI